MDQHREFTAWTVKNGLKINGIAPHKFLGRGLGIVAVQKHEAGVELLSVPRTALRTAGSVSKAISRKLGKISVHGLLAVDLSFDSSPARAAWRAVLSSTLQALLPPAAKALLENQQKKFLKDWNTASQPFPELDKEILLYKWLIVNTRNFYWTVPRAKNPAVPDDCMALNPFADYFNHADEGCKVEYGPMGFNISSDRVYEKDEEIYISYGNHCNNFLMAEYGFILLENKWDEIQLDHVIPSELSTRQRDLLEGAGFLGKHVLDQHMVCHRTQVAVRLICVRLRKWHRFVKGEDDGEED